MLARYSKPSGCSGCVLESTGKGYAPPDGPANSPLLFYGESLGYYEAIDGRPFMGPAGSMFARILKRAQFDRENVRVHSIVNCQPPGDWLDGAPWEHAAVNQCQSHVMGNLDEWVRSTAHFPERVVVTLGTLPLRTVLQLGGSPGIRVQDFHGTVHRDPTDRFWVVPTYHPSHLQRGALNLLDVVRFDLGVARRVLTHGHTPAPVSLVQDPPVAWFVRWVERFLAAAAQDPAGVWLALDIETPDKAGGRDEGELSTEDQSTRIDRVNLACDTHEGVTVPYEGPYIPLLDRLFTADCIKLLWNKNYDLPRIRFNGHTIGGDSWDLMWAAKHLQSDLPLGLGFWAPFYSDYGAWKHLSKQHGREVEYAAVDGLQTLRIGHGIVKDLVESSLWDGFYRHNHELEHYVLRPAHEVGVTVDVQKLDAFHEKLNTIAGEKLTKLKAYAPVGQRRPKQGYTSRPKGDECTACNGTGYFSEADIDANNPCATCGGTGVLAPQPPASLLGKVKGTGTETDAKRDYMKSGITLIEVPVRTTVLSCATCGLSPAPKKHQCKVPKGLTPRGMGKMQRQAEEAAWLQAHPTELVTLDAIQPRWFWQLPFNPDAPAQLLKYIEDSGQKAGKNKQTKRAAADKSTLARLAKSTGDPIYRDVLDYKAVKKVDSTYVLGSKRRIWADGRLHPFYTFRPSTFRLSYVNPNITNVVADKGGAASLAAGFRECIIAGQTVPEWAPAEMKAEEQQAPAVFKGTRLLECVAPGTRILKADLTWDKAENLKVGDELIGFDVDSEGRGKESSRFRSATVTHTEVLHRPRVRVETTDGDITVAANHPFLARWHKANRKWRTAMDLQPGMLVSFLAAPWETDTTRDGGYLAGFFDGEGWVSGTTVGWGQNSGPVQEHVKRLLTVRGFEFHESLGSSTAQCEVLTGLRESLRVLGTLRPLRLLAKSRGMWEGRRTWGKRTIGATVLRVTQLDAGAVIALSTSTKTYIAEGFFSHNCDYSGIEAVETGYYIGDPDTIRLATLGIHAYLTSHLVGDPADLAWSDSDLSAFFSKIKKKFPQEYDKAKRCVHGNNYGLTTYGMAENFPDLFPTPKEAERVQALYYALVPKLPGWHKALRVAAHENGRLGGPETLDYGQLTTTWQYHPFGYRHWFWGVLGYKPITTVQLQRMRQAGKNTYAVINSRPFKVVYGEDSKRVIAFFPQSTAAGVLKESMLRLFHPDSPSYIGDQYYGRTPLRAPIHDSLLLEIPARRFDYVASIVLGEMQRPIVQQPLPPEWGRGEYLRVGVAAKTGLDWMHTEDLDVAGLATEVAAETMYLGETDEDQDEFDALERQVLEGVGA